MAERSVILSHDGGLDDYLCAMLVLLMPDIDLLGVVVTPADCYIDPAIGGTRKILDLLGSTTVPVAASTVRGLNPFPRALRRTSWQVDNLPILNTKDHLTTPLVPESGQEWLAKTLLAAETPVVFLETGPFSTLAEAIKIEPTIVDKIERILWMGGALNVHGNVSPYVDANIDGSQEWNVYWDPIAAHEIWQTDIPITMCPLDITNNVPLTAEFMARLGRNHHYPLSDLAGQLYALVRHQPYYFWDVLTTCYLGIPEIYQTREWETVLVPTGPSQGRTKVEAGGKLVTAMDQVDVPRLYDYLIDVWAA
jgi:purine nucleosidase